jgi:hypothetical protein
MRQYSYFLIAIGIVVVIAAFTIVDQSEAAPEPKRRSGGSSRKSGSSGTSWFGGGKKQSNSGSSWFGGSKKTQNTGYGGKKKSKTKSNLKKAAVIGATAYGAYQLGKLSGRFSSPGYGYGNRGYGYQQWNSWREVDGFLCRKTEDCNWIDPRLYCQDYELKFTPQHGWFGGDYLSIVGECACPHGMRWNNYEVECQTNYFSGTNLLLVVLIPILLLGCCCCVGIYFARKMFS